MAKRSDSKWQVDKLFHCLSLVNKVGEKDDESKEKMLALEYQARSFLYQFQTGMAGGSYSFDDATQAALTASTIRNMEVVELLANTTDLSQIQVPFLAKRDLGKFYWVEAGAAGAAPTPSRPTAACE